MVSSPPSNSVLYIFFSLFLSVRFSFVIRHRQEFLNCTSFGNHSSPTLNRKWYVSDAVGGGVWFHNYFSPSDGLPFDHIQPRGVLFCFVVSRLVFSFLISGRRCLFSARFFFIFLTAKSCIPPDRNDPSFIWLFGHHLTMAARSVSVMLICHNPYDGCVRSGKRPFT